MSDDLNKFWKHLQEQAADPEGFVPLTDAEAERRMAAAGEEPMSEAEIARIVETATAQGPRVVVAHRRVQTRQLRHWTKAAAVLLGAVLFAAAGVWVWRGVYIEDLPYREAFEFALNREEVEAKRRTATGRLLSQVAQGVQVLKAVQKEGGQLGASADGVLRGLRRILSGEDSFNPSRDWPRVRRIRQPIEQLRVFVADATQAEDARVEKQLLLDEQVRLGILALKRLRNEPPPPPPKQSRVAADAATYLETLTRILGSD